MKKIIFIAIVTLWGTFTLKAQPIPNGSFENWFMNHYYDEPIPGVTSNLQSYFTIGSGNVEQTGDSYAGNYAISLSTVTDGVDTVPGIYLLGNPGPGGLSGGIPFLFFPDSVYGYFKFEIMPNDTASVIMQFTNNGNPVGFAMFTFAGTQTTYTRYDAPIFWIPPATPPDTLLAIVSSSNINGTAIPGSNLIIDEIHFTNAPGSPVGDFEDWTAVESEDPEDWESLNFAWAGQGLPSTTKTTDAIDGNFALQLVTSVSPFGDTLGYLSNGIVGDDFFEGGMAVSQNPSMITGYYKYNTPGQDTALVAALLTYWDVATQSRIAVDSAYLRLSPASTYTPFTINFNYNGFPMVDTMLIVFGSSNWDNESVVTVGSTLLIDKLEIFYNPVSVAENSISNLNLYPNPAKDLIVLNSAPGNASIEIYDLKGSMVLQYSGKDIRTLNVSALPEGSYSLKLIQENQVQNQKFVIVR